MISKRAQAVDTSGIRRVFELAASLKDPINLSIGQPDFGPTDEVIQQGIAAIKGANYGYTVTQGIPEFREKVRQRYNISSSDQQRDVFVTAGVSGGLLLSFMVLLDPGDEILIPDPFFCIYRDLALMINAVPSYYDTYPNFALNVENISQAITDKTRAIVVNSPANPTGYACSQQELDQVVELARAHDLYLIYDEIYDAFCYDSAHAQCFHNYEKTIVLNAFSKTGGVPGWRIGYGAGPKDIIQAMCKLQQYTIVCANSVAQRAIIPAFDADFTPILDQYRAKRDFIVSELSADFNFVKPGGAFYIFPEAPGGSGQAFVERCIAKGLLVVPGNVFSRSDSHFRISFSAPQATLERGVEVLRQLVRG